MSRFNKDVVRYNERELNKSFSEKSLFGKIVTVFSGFVLLLCIAAIFFILVPENTDYAGEADTTAYDTQAVTVIEESFFSQQ